MVRPQTLYPFPLTIHDFLSPTPPAGRVYVTVTKTATELVALREPQPRGYTVLVGMWIIAVYLFFFWPDKNLWARTLTGGFFGWIGYTFLEEHQVSPPPPPRLLLQHTRRHICVRESLSHPSPTPVVFFCFFFTALATCYVFGRSRGAARM